MMRSSSIWTNENAGLGELTNQMELARKREASKLRHQVFGFQANFIK